MPLSVLTPSECGLVLLVKPGFSKRFKRLSKLTSGVVV